MKKLFICLFGLLFIFSCNVAWAATGQNQNKIQQLWAQGEKLEQRGDFEQAIKVYTKAISLKPNSAEAYFRRGGCYSSWFYSDHNNSQFGANSISINYIQSALADYTKAIELNPYNLDYYFNRALLYKDDEKKLSDYRKMVELTTAKIAKAPDITSYYYKRRAETMIDGVIQAAENRKHLAEMREYSSKGYSYSPEDSKKMETERLEKFKADELKKQQIIQEDKIIASLKPKDIEEEVKQYYILSDISNIHDGYIMYKNSLMKNVEENNKIKLVKVSQEEIDERKERREKVLSRGMDLLEKKGLNAWQKMTVLSCINRIVIMIPDNEITLDKERFLEHCEQAMELAEKEGKGEKYNEFIRNIESRFR